MNAQPPAIRHRNRAVASRRRGWLLAVATAVAVLLGPAAPAAAETADPVVARVNGIEIRASDVAMAQEDFAQSLRSTTPDAQREELITYIAVMMLAAKAAEDKKLVSPDDLKRQLAYARNKILMNAMVTSEAKAAVTEEAMRKVYDEAAKNPTGEQEVHVRHILVEAEPDAVTIIAELKKGADFTTLAKAKSKDPSVAQNGGDLGFITRDQTVPEFSEVAFKLEVGQISDPVKSAYGWHVIRVDEKREQPFPPFDKIKGQIAQYLMRKAQSELIARLSSDAKIERLDAKPDGTAVDPGKK